MATDRRITLFHSPRTRSTGALVLLEELGADYELHAVNMKAGEQRQRRSSRSTRSARCRPSSTATPS